MFFGEVKLFGQLTFSENRPFFGESTFFGESKFFGEIFFDKMLKPLHFRNYPLKRRFACKTRIKWIWRWKTFSNTTSRKRRFFNWWNPDRNASDLRSRKWKFERSTKTTQSKLKSHNLNVKNTEEKAQMYSDRSVAKYFSNFLLES